jgi:hypothetical protein
MAQNFVVRRQSVAATALLERSKSGVALRLPPHYKEVDVSISCREQ